MQTNKIEIYLKQNFKFQCLHARAGPASKVKVGLVVKSHYGFTNVREMK